MATKRAALVLFLSFVVSCFTVIFFLMFGPLYVGGTLAIQQAWMWVLALTILLVWPVHALFKRRDRPRPSR